jgi:HTH-type transcriptional regulator / antitoxin HipB
MAKDQNLPFGKIVDVEDLGRCVRAQRKAQGATQADFAALCGVGNRFISELENGKPTMELGKVLQVLKCLGLEVQVTPRGQGESRYGTLRQQGQAE